MTWHKTLSSIAFRYALRVETMKLVEEELRRFNQQGEFGNAQ